MREVFERAAQLIQTRGLAKGVYQSRGGILYLEDVTPTPDSSSSYCVVGALWVCAEDNIVLFEKCREALRIHLNLKYRDDILHWSDSNDAETVVAVLKELANA